MPLSGGWALQTRSRGSDTGTMTALVRSTLGRCYGHSQRPSNPATGRSSNRCYPPCGPSSTLTTGNNFVDYDSSLRKRWGNHACRVCGSGRFERPSAPQWYAIAEYSTRGGWVGGSDVHDILGAHLALDVAT
eukprot:6475208-Pyramimonas_sp.AAC.1